MTKNKFFPKILLIIFLSVVFSACTQESSGVMDKDGSGSGRSKANPSDVSVTDKRATGSQVINNSNDLDYKNQEITLTGNLIKSGNIYLIKTSDGKAQDLESYTIDFDKSVGKTVTVTGEFSGDTLFVTHLE